MKKVVKVDLNETEVVQIPGIIINSYPLKSCESFIFVSVEDNVSKAVGERRIYL